MNTLSQFHDVSKSLSAVPVFKSLQGKTIAMALKKGGLLPEHITPIPAVLVCVSGQINFQNEQGIDIVLSPGEFYEIEPNVKHWLKGLEDAQLLLLK